MRIRLPLAIAAAMLAIQVGDVGPASAQQVLQPGAADTDDAAPTVLRGSAVAPRPAPPPTDPGRWQIAAGDDLWLVDPAAGEVVACNLRGTSTVGVRIVRCYTDDLPRIVAD